jgi:hypothetical protein
MSTLSGIGKTSISPISQLEAVTVEQIGQDALLRGRCVHTLKKVS